jgi:hypothetical protein
MNTRTPIFSASPLRPNAEPGMTPASAMAKTSSGNARKMSIRRPMKLSTQPPKKAAVTPMVTPMITDSPVARNAMSSEIRLP